MMLLVSAVQQVNHLYINISPISTPFWIIFPY